MVEEETSNLTDSRSPCAVYVGSVLEALGDLFHRAETSLHEIPTHTLTTVRACGVVFAKEYLRRHGHVFEESMNFADLLNNEHFRDPASRTVRNELHWIRKTGNRAAHPEEGSLDRAEAGRLAPEALKKLYMLIVDHLTDQERRDGAPEFVLPSEDSSNRMCGDAVLRDDADSQYRLGLRAKTIASTMHKELLEEVLSRGGGWIRSREMDREFEEAHYWFRRAAQDDRKPAAVYELAHLHIDGRIDGYDLSRGMEFLNHADRLGVADASALLGLFALEGEYLIRQELRWVPLRNVKRHWTGWSTLPLMEIPQP